MTNSPLVPYQHTQKGPWWVLVLLLGIVFLTVAWTMPPDPVVSIILSCSAPAMVVVAASFHDLTVADKGDCLIVRFGPLPLFQKRIRYDDIRRVELGRTSPIEGWGIRLSLRGG